MRINLALLIAIILLGMSFEVATGFGYGKTWLGRNLELQMENARFNLGPFRISPALVLSNAGYDSNVYYGATDKPVEDLTFTAGMAFDVYLPIKKRLIFTIYESPQYVYFKETERERTWNNYFRGQVHLVANRFVATAGVSSSEAKERWNTEIDLRILRKERSAQGSLLWQPANKTPFTLSYRMARYDYGEGGLGGLYYSL